MILFCLKFQFKWKVKILVISLFIFHYLCRKMTNNHVYLNNQNSLKGHKANPTIFLMDNQSKHFWRRGRFYYRYQRHFHGLIYFSFFFCFFFFPFLFFFFFELWPSTSTFGICCALPQLKTFFALSRLDRNFSYL